MSRSTLVRAEMRGPIRDLFRNTDSAIISGPAGTGKSFQTLLSLHLIMLKYPGTRALVVRKVAPSLTAITLATFRAKVAVTSMAPPPLDIYGGCEAAPTSCHPTHT